MSKPNKTSGGPFSPHRSPEQYGGVHSFIRDYFNHLKTYMLTGLLVWVPLIVTVGVAWWVISTIGFGLEGLIKSIVVYLNTLGHKYSWLSFLGSIAYWPGFGFLITIFLCLSTGFFARYIAGQKLIAASEWLLQKIPLIRTVYTAAQQIRDVFINRDGKVFHDVVMIQCPQPGQWVFGFITSRERGLVQEAVGADLLAVYVPTSHPYAGYLVYVKESDVVRLDISVEDALKQIASCGAYVTPCRRAATTPTTTKTAE